MSNKVKSIVLAAVTIAFLVNSGISAQDSKNKIVNLSDQVIANLLVGIKSDNPGLKNCCIYLAGKYEVEKTAKSLLDELRNNFDADTRILIVRSLYQIGGDKYQDEIINLAMNDENPEVRKMASALSTVIEMERYSNIEDFQE